VLFVACTVVVLGADLVFKQWAFDHIAPGAPVVLDPDQPNRPIPHHEPINLVPHVLSLQLVTNTGAVFGIGKGAQGMFAVVSVVATVVILFVFLRSERGAWVQQTALALILAGALGNLHDRIRFNAVRDMLWLFPDVKLPLGLAWPGGNPDLYPWRFNIADAALVVGVGLTLILMWRAEKQAKQAKQ